MRHTCLILVKEFQEIESGWLGIGILKSRFFHDDMTIFQMTDFAKVVRGSAEQMVPLRVVKWW